MGEKRGEERERWSLCLNWAKWRERKRGALERKWKDVMAFSVLRPLASMFSFSCSPLLPLFFAYSHSTPLRLSPPLSLSLLFLFFSIFFFFFFFFFFFLLFSPIYHFSLYIYIYMSNDLIPPKDTTFHHLAT